MFFNRLISDILRTTVTAKVLESGGNCVFTTRDLQDIEAHLPVVRARATGPAVTKPNQEFSMFITVDAYARTEDEAAELTKLVYQTLHAAWRQQTVFTDGHIRQFACLVFGDNVSDPSMPDGVVRFLSNYDALVRPIIPA